MTATAPPTPIPAGPSTPPPAMPSALLGSPVAAPDRLWGRTMRRTAHPPYPPAGPGDMSAGEQMWSTPVSAVRLMAAESDCLRTSAVSALMVEAARLRTVSETDLAAEAAWDSEGDHSVRAVRDPGTRPRIPAVAAVPVDPATGR